MVQYFVRGDGGGKRGFVLEDLRPCFNGFEIGADSFAVFEFFRQLGHYFFKEHHCSGLVPLTNFMTNLDDLLLNILATFPAGFYVHEVVISDKLIKEPTQEERNRFNRQIVMKQVLKQTGGSFTRIKVILVCIVGYNIRLIFLDLKVSQVQILLDFLQLQWMQLLLSITCDLSDICLHGS